MRRGLPPLTLMGLALVLVGCTQNTTPPPAAQADTPQTLMLRVAKQVQACWFKKNDPALRPYRMASEIDSYSGKPRILIVPRRNPEGLPKLVAQAERVGGRNQFNTFGPLLDGKDGPRLSASLNAWARGQSTC